MQAQQLGKVARLGLLGLFTRELGSRSVAAVRDGLGDLGWHDGQNMHFEHRYASGKRDQLGVLATELVQQKVDVIVAFGTDATRAARGATSSIPIVMGAVSDPVASGFATSLACDQRYADHIQSCVRDARLGINARSRRAPPRSARARRCYPCARRPG